MALTADRVRPPARHSDGWGVVGTWLGMVYDFLSNSDFSLVGGRGRPLLREGDAFLIDLVEEDEREMMREGCNAAEVWRVSEVRGLNQMHIREAAMAGGSMEKLAGKGKAGEAWGEVMRRVAAPRGSELDGEGRRRWFGSRA